MATGEGEGGGLVGVRFTRAGEVALQATRGGGWRYGGEGEGGGEGGDGGGEGGGDGGGGCRRVIGVRGIHTPRGEA